MTLPRPTWLSVRTALHRPAVLLPVTAVSLAGLLATGLLVANAVDAPPSTPVSAPATPTPGPSQATAAAGTAPVAGGDAPATTTSGGDDNVAVAVNTRDGSTVYALRLKVVITGADVVDSGNAAVAAASCSDCQTVAVALEGVIVTGDAEVVAPVNLALAVNTECSGCQTLAYAYQHLQTVDGRVRLTGKGRRTIADLRRQLNALRTSGLDVPAVAAEVDRIAAEFAAVLESEVVSLTAPPTAAQTSDAGAAGTAGAAGAGVQSSPATTQDQPTPAPTPEPSATTGGATPSPTPAGTATASPPSG